jgi:hypothetical protein
MSIMAHQVYLFVLENQHHWKEEIIHRNMKSVLQWLALRSYY